MKYKKTVLKNGIRVITIPMFDNPTVTVMVLVEAGSEYETKEQNGISHFLEHLCFKGTTMRPTAFDITKELDGLGAQSNAFTAQELTGYYAKAQKKHVSKLLDIISDLYSNPVFDATEIEKEKGVIIDEISMYEDIPMQYVRDIFMNVLYGDQPAGRTIVGKKEIIRALTRDDILSYRKKHYVAKATTVVISGGGFEEKKIIKDIEKLFVNIPHDVKSKKKKVFAKQEKPMVALEQKKSDQTHIVLGVRTYGLYHKDNPIIEVTAGVLGRGMSSRLFQKLRDEMGVGYYVRAGNEMFTDHGVLSISTGVSNDRVPEVIQAILEECKKLTQEEVAEQELKNVKDFLTGNFLLGLESSDSLAVHYGFQEILKEKIKDPQTIVREIQAVTAKDIKAVARRIFNDKSLDMAVLGSLESKKALEKICTFCK